ncbi:glyoxylase-like metal-dependent hydrolase (beta-lactamase superfamily II) [Amycolatopsis bartoniae]|uniref:MBL fold metallo-hydrolase n=1 Tax=Amycolatopsis bartoniae TaxID=941986 RepID=A0A8H9J1M8_9PSEU|nr:MBL fold metallo-hydrolase [Amycolatopsis bartoniae]MBB2935202.1 glyoxylase-like metal-dependent hydrolase (beta-lactamase superfamily II) [Amycolatopsis bartoniae]TVT04086.1 MBL fold metallo-hydrolase [Amycolatopsis bartoniae]GHF75082.1 MBL fold metallo-hydrolase [Amycolatopsis bartoniae]
MTHPAYGELRQVSPVASVLLENNPSMMTLEGTNTWVLRAPGAAESVLVDPGYHDLDHLPKLAELGPVALILLTHHHTDHSEGAPWLAERTGAPVRAFDQELCRDAGALTDGEVVSAAGLELEVLHTPGHTADSVCLRLEGHVLTGDTILGRGTTVLADLGSYLRSLRRLVELPAGQRGLPGHGPELPDLKATAQEYLDHREQRLDQVRRALSVLGEDATPRQVVEHVYADIDQELWAPAEHSVRAQLDYLRSGD